MRVAAILVFAFPVPSAAQSLPAPQVSARANAPAMVTLDWLIVERDGSPLVGFRVERLDIDRHAELGHEKRSFSDHYLQPSTTYWYRVCAAYAVEKEPRTACSDSVSATTLAAAAPRTSERLTVRVLSDEPGRAHVTWSGSRRYDFFQLRFGPWSQLPQRDEGRDRIGPSGSSGAYTLTQLRPGERYRVQVQGCQAPGPTNPFSSSCSGFSEPVDFLAHLARPPAPRVTVVPDRSDTRVIALRWSLDGDQIDRVRVLRDGSVIRSGAPVTDLLDRTVRPNTDYVYQVCVSNPAGESCSNDVTASGRPTPPSAPLRLTGTRMGTGGAGGASGSAHEAARKTDPIVVLRWAHESGTRYVPGRFVVVERADRELADRRGRMAVGWRELSRLPGRSDPTGHNVSLRAELGVRAGSTYRVCAVVPELGDAGKACSAPVTVRQ